MLIFAVFARRHSQKVEELKHSGGQGRETIYAHKAAYNDGYFDQDGEDGGGGALFPTLDAWWMLTARCFS